MKKPLLSYLMAFITLLSTDAWAQTNASLTTELAKAEKQLTKAFKQIQNAQEHNFHGVRYFEGGESIATYIKEYGVMIKLPKVYLGISSRRVRRDHKTGKLYIRVNRKKQIALEEGKYHPRDYAYYTRSGKKPDYTYTLINRNQVVAQRKAAIQSTMKEFLANAAGLMSHLSNDEKIELIYDHEVYSYSHRRKKNRAKMPRFIKASIDKGTWSKNKDQITLSNTKPTTNHQQLAVMASIIESLYKRNVSNSFYGYSRVKYHELGKVGVLYDLRLSQRVNAERDENVVSIKDGKVIDSDSIRARKSGNYEQIKAQRQQANRQAYQKFEQEIKSYLVDYGKVVKGVDADKWLVLNVVLPERWYTADDASVPRSVQVRVKAGVLQDVKAGKITAANAQNQVVLQKY